MTKALPLMALALIIVGCSSEPAPTQADPAKVVTAPLTDAAPTVPAGKITPESLAAQADVPIYPGCTFPDSKTQVPKKDEAGKMHTYLIMSTTDSVDKVVEFYKTHGKYEPMQTKDGTEIQGLSPKGNLVLIDLTAGPSKTIISVKSVQGS